ncbi:telomere length regulation protein TEL2 homolog isoform X2 [Pyxicephalus adspersus]
MSVRSVVHDALNDLSNITDKDALVGVLTNMKRYLGKGDNPASVREISEFCRTHYSPFLRALVCRMGPQWIDLLTSEHLDLWDSFFIDGPADQAFLVLLESIGQTRPCARLDCCVNVLEKFLQRGALAEVIWEICEQQLAPITTPVLHEVYLTKICNLPDYLANCLQKNNKSVFYPQNYFPRVGTAILKVLHIVSMSLRDGKGCSINFVSQLLGKVCMQGRQKELFSVLLPHLTTKIKSDCIWQRMCWRLIGSVPDRWMEPVIIGLVQMLPGPSALSQILGDLVLKNKKANFILTQKLLFLQYGHKKEMLQTILGYLAIEPSCRTLLSEVLWDLLELWSSNNIVKHSPYPQMLHISRCIFICIGLLSKQELEGSKPELVHGLTCGTRIYLESSLPPVRRLGMVVAECLSLQIDNSGPRLTFEYTEDDDIRELKALLNPPCICPSDLPAQAKAPSKSSAVPAPKGEKRQEKPKTDTGSGSELDSDDDLNPFDMSADTELKKIKAPAYIRDCMEALISDDVEKLEIAMTSLPLLIRANSAATKEVSTELAKILLNLDDHSGIEHFTQLRLISMVSVTVTDPVPVSKYLIGEFYSLNYSLRQRMDILDVLASAAQELSNLPPPQSKAKAGDPRLASSSKGDGPVDWRKVVEERIASKTKHFSKGQKQAPPTPAPNRYYLVAGDFFFPLIRNFDRPVVTFNPLGADHLVLGRMVQTLGILIHLAQHAPTVTQMGKAMLELVWALNHHTDPFVRQGLIFCVCTVLLTVSWDRLLIDMGDLVMEMKSWLSDLVEKDPDEDCSRLAANGLLLIDHIRTEANKENLGS